MKRKTILLFLGMLLCCFVASMTAALLLTEAISSSPEIYLALTVSVALGGLFGFKGFREARTATETPEVFQARYNRSFRVLPLVAMPMAALCVLQLSALWDHPGNNLRLAFAAVMATSAFAMIWAYALMLSGSIRAPFRFLIQDEFFQDNLSKSRSNGFYALLALLTLCFFIGLFSARLAVALLPFAAGFGVAFAGWRFNRRDARALASDDAK